VLYLILNYDTAARTQCSEEGFRRHWLDPVAGNRGTRKRRESGLLLLKPYLVPL
jgi:hypothetical protein